MKPIRDIDDFIARLSIGAGHLLELEPNLRFRADHYQAAARSADLRLLNVATDPIAVALQQFAVSVRQQRLGRRPTTALLRMEARLIVAAYRHVGLLPELSL